MSLRRPSATPFPWLSSRRDLLLCLTLLTPTVLHAQLPAGTTDASSSSSSSAQPTEDPVDRKLRTDAADALQQQNFPAALKALTALAERHPDNAPILFNLASTEDALDQDSTAVATYRRSIAADPTYLQPHLGLGLLLARTNHPDQARSELVTATTLQQADPALRARAFRTLAHLDLTTNPAEARDALLAALKLSPETPEDILLSAQLAANSNDLPAAEAAYRRLLATDPANADASTALAALLHRQHKDAEADKLLQQTSTAHPDDPAVAARLATAYAKAGDLPRAIALIAPLQQKNPAEPSLTRLLAHLYALAGDYTSAEPLLAQLHTQSPTDPVLADEDADALIRLRRPAEAEALLKAAIARPDAFPSRDAFAEAASHLAFAASQNNDPETVLQALNLRATVQPQSPATLFLEATARDKLHQIKQAESLYRQFLSVSKGQFPNEEWEARHRLLALAHTR